MFSWFSFSHHGQILTLHDGHSPRRCLLCCFWTSSERLSIKPCAPIVSLKTLGKRCQCVFQWSCSIKQILCFQEGSYKILIFISTCSSIANHHQSAFTWKIHGVITVIALKVEMWKGGTVDWLQNYFLLKILISCLEMSSIKLASQCLRFTCLTPKG